jgi:hypothetical protein
MSTFGNDDKNCDVVIDKKNTPSPVFIPENEEEHLDITCNDESEDGNVREELESK